MDWIWSLFEGECTGCGICADLCPHDAIDIPAEQAYPAGIEAACTGCMICVEECPFDAIVVWERASTLNTIPSSSQPPLRSVNRPEPPPARRNPHPTHASETPGFG